MYVILMIYDHVLSCLVLNHHFLGLPSNPGAFALEPCLLSHSLGQTWASGFKQPKNPQRR